MSEISLDPILTDAGLAALQNSDATGIAAKITHVALGDVGATPIPSVQALQMNVCASRVFQEESRETDKLH